MSNLCPYDIT